MRSWVLLPACAALCFGGQGSSGSPDALVVRAVYAKLVHATKVRALREYVYDAQSKEPDIADSLVISLSDIQTGPLSDILGRRLSELVTKPSGSVLRTTPGIWTHRTEERLELKGAMASLRWADAKYLAEDWDVPMSRVLGAIDPGYSRYAAFSVNLAFDGRKRQYAAMFLFGEDEAGKPMILPVDHIIGIPALSGILTAPALPQPLLLPEYAARPRVSDFIKSLQASPQCIPEPQSGLCCDETTGKCGVRSEAWPVPASASAIQDAAAFASDGLSAEIVRPIPLDNAYCSPFNSTGAQANNGAADTGGHIDGDHHIFASYTGHCTYSGNCSPCNVICHVSQDSLDVKESGATYSMAAYFFHVLGQNSSVQDGSGANQSCGSGAGAGVKSCYLSLCSVTVTVGFGGTGVQIGSDGFWTGSTGLVSGGCAPKG